VAVLFQPLPKYSPLSAIALTIAVCDAVAARTEQHRLHRLAAPI
jgi:hypothetical protein